jgi:hypothetical protein
VLLGLQDQLDRPVGPDHQPQRRLPPPRPSVVEPSPARGALRDLLRPPYLGCLVLFVVVWFVCYLGNYG